MSDLISKEVAIDMLTAVRDLVWDVDIPSPTVPEYIEHHEQMQSIMRNIDVLTEKIVKMPSAQRWIPCSEKYPDMDERVLVYTMDHEYHVWDCMSNRSDPYFWEDEDGLYHNKYEVDEWMPLPEPYKEGE